MNLNAIWVCLLELMLLPLKIVSVRFIVFLSSLASSKMLWEMHISHIYETMPDKVEKFVLSLILQMCLRRNMQIWNSWNSRMKKNRKNLELVHVISSLRDLFNYMWDQREKERIIQRMLPSRRGTQFVTQNSLDPHQSSTVPLITLFFFSA